jgi:polyphosphate kinase
MKLYQDEDTSSVRLTQLLRKAKHDVQTTTEAGLRGRNDAVQQRHAIQTGRVLLTQNYDDFEELHDLIREAQGHHPGILVVRKDNNRKRDMDDHDIVSALAKLIASGVAVADEFIILNQWQ